MNATMTTLTTTTCGSIILAIDLGKYKSVVCWYDRLTSAARFTTIDSTGDNFDRLLSKERPALVVIEACAPAGWVYDLCARLGLVCKVANTASEAWKFKHAKRKTDRDDALRLAQLEALGQLPSVTVPPKETREWRSLIAARTALVGRRVAVQNRIRAILVGQGMAAPRGQRAWSAVGLQGIAQYSRPLADCEPEELWRGLLDLALSEYRQLVQLIGTMEGKLDARAKQDRAVQILETIPGVGPRTAETVAAYLSEPTRFASGKQVSAYGGLVPRQFQSGEQDRRGRITRRGPALLRKMLVECAWGMLRYNAWARAVYRRLTHGGKTHKKQAIVALARKLLVRCWAMLRDRKPWRDESTPPPALATAP